MGLKCSWRFGNGTQLYATGDLENGTQMQLEVWERDSIICNWRFGEWNSMQLEVWERNSIKCSWVWDSNAARGLGMELN